MAKDIRYNVEARELLKEGVDALSNAVKVTLGYVFTTRVG